MASLDRVAQDGVRVRASAGAASFRRHSTLQECAAPREDHSQWLQRRKETVSKLIADLTPRSLRLSDDELFGFWRATARMGYPTSPLHRLRLLTGMRLNVRVLASDRADGLPDRRAAAQLSCSEVHGRRP